MFLYLSLNQRVKFEEGQFGKITMSRISNFISKDDILINERRIKVERPKLRTEIFELTIKKKNPLLSYNKQAVNKINK